MRACLLRDRLIYLGGYLLTCHPCELGPGVVVLRGGGGGTKKSNFKVSKGKGVWVVFEEKEF